MKILITVGTVIIFISAFFVLATGNAIFSNAFSCETEESGTVCEFDGFTPPATIGILLIAFFLVIDAFSVYLIFTNIK